MPEEPVNLPFTAVIGMDAVKKALMCMMADRSMKGLLIRGPSGTAKSLLVRSFFELFGDAELVNVPLDTPDEEIFGGLDIEKAISEGRTEASGGLLKRADGNFLFLDNINLFETGTAVSIMDCILSGNVILEREGISAEYSVSTAAIATMDPAEREIPDDLADRFEMCISIIPIGDAEVRADIAMLGEEFRADPRRVRERNSIAGSEVIRAVSAAGKIMSQIEITRDNAVAAARMCAELGSHGHRGDIAVVRTARALAALDGRTSISKEDVRDSAVMCLSRRRAEEETVQTVSLEDVSERGPVTMDDAMSETGVDRIAGHSGERAANTEAADESDDGIESARSDLDRIREFESIRLHEIVGIKNKRSDIVTGDDSGRYRRFRMPTGKITDPAFDATVRAAAPHQRTRDRRGLSIAIAPQDIREKVRVKRDSSSFLFIVDTSGSLVVGRMMDVVQDAIRAMLEEAYVKRDRVALITFRENEADIVVPFTRSAEKIHETLAHSPTGGSTPLNAALVKAREYLVNYTRKNPLEKCYVILITDGQGNVPVVSGKEPLSELKRIASVARIPNTEWTVIDSSDGFSMKKDAARLARYLGARYVGISDLGH